MIRELIVVEGKADTEAVRRAVDAETIETGGSAIGPEVIARIRLAQQCRGVIVLTDPDHPGERIRSLITEHVPGCKHAFIRREDARTRKGIGVEHASPEAIRNALAFAHTDYVQADVAITASDLVEAGLLGNDDAAERRKRLGDQLGIGYCNGKQLLKRLRMFQISREQYRLALQAIDEQG